MCSALALIVALAIGSLLLESPLHEPLHQHDFYAESGTRQLEHIHLEGFDSALATGRAIYLRKLANGPVTAENFGVVSFPHRSLQDAEVLVETRFLSVDPYMRGSMGFKGTELPALNKTSDIMRDVLPRILGGVNVGVVKASTSAALPVGTLVRGPWRWADSVVLSEAWVEKLQPYHHPPHIALGALGLTARTAYHGVFDILRPRPNEVLFVTGAAGATGMVAGQLGKLAGCRVVGSAGSEKKVRYLIDTLGFDDAINYKEDDIEAALDRLVPDGVDLLFENTGGFVSEAVLWRLRPGARVAVSGLIDLYNDMGDWRRLAPKLFKAALPRSWHPVQELSFSQLWRGVMVKYVAHVLIPLNQLKISTCDRQSLRKELPLLGENISVENFLVTCWSTLAKDVEAKLSGWLQDGRLKNTESIIKGSLEDAPRAFAQMMSGHNIGKQVVELAV